MLTNLKKKGLVLAESSRYSPSFGDSRHVETAGHVMSCHVTSCPKRKLRVAVAMCAFPPLGQPRIPAQAWCHPQWAALPSSQENAPWAHPESHLLGASGFWDVDG